MKKNLKFLSAAVLSAAILGPGITGCQNYDDDIQDLQSQINDTKSSISEIQGLVAQGKLVQMVEAFSENSQNGFAITFSDGTVKKLFTNDTDKTAVIEIKDGYWYINGVNSNIPAIVDDGSNGTNGTDGKDGVDGTDGKDGVDGTDGKDGVDGKDGHSPYIQDGYWYFWDATADKFVKWEAAPAAAGMWVQITDKNYILHAIDEKGQPIEITLPKSMQSIGSLTFVPEFLSEKLGEVVYFPVITTDYTKKTSENQKEHEFDKLNFEIYQTIYDGYSHMTYLVNPNGANDYKVLGFTKKQVVLTKSAEEGLKFWSSVPEMGKLNVKAKGFKFVKTGDMYDDPHGTNPSNNWQKKESDMIALQVMNNASADTVTSDYIAVKRLVVKQHEIHLGLKVDNTINQKPMACPNERILTQFPTFPNEAAKNAYFTDAPVDLYVSFVAKTDLKPIVMDCVKKLYTNMGDEMNGHYHLGEIGFEDLSYVFTPVGYMNAEVNQTDRYLILENGVVSFDKSNTAAGYRQPVVRVELFGADKTLITTAFIKMQVVPVLQAEKNYPEKNMGNLMINCLPNDKKDFFDMDPVFNDCGMTKNDFVSNYDGSVVLERFNGSAWVPVEPESVDIELTPMVFVTAVDGINYLKVKLNTCAKIGKYRAIFMYEAKNTSAPFGKIKLPLLFEVKNHEPKMGILGPNWEGNLLKVNPSPYNPSQHDMQCHYDYNMKDAFNFSDGRFTFTNIPCESYIQHVYFVFKKTGTNVYRDASNHEAAWLVPDDCKDQDKRAAAENMMGEELNGKIQHLILDKNVPASRAMVGKTVTIQAWGYVNGCKSNKVLLKEFDAKFIIPLTMVNNTPAIKLVDAEKNGSPFNLKDFVPTITDWRGIKIVDKSGNHVMILDKELYKHYGIHLFDENHYYHTVFDLDKAKCNLAESNGDIVINESARNPLPERFELKFDSSDPSKIVFINTTVALQKDWKMYIPYKITHFWGEFTGYIEITVTKNPGTPNGAPAQR